MKRQIRRGLSGAMIGALVAPPALAGASPLSAPRFPIAPGPACSNPAITWKYAAAVGAPDGPPDAATQTAGINGFNKWLGTGLKKSDGTNLFTVAQNNSATFKVYFRDLAFIHPLALGGYSCSWNVYFSDIPAGTPAIVIGDAALPYGSSVFTHEMGHALGFNHSGLNDSLSSTTTGSRAVMNTCVGIPFNAALGRDDYAQAQYRGPLAAHTANPGFETTSVGWDSGSAAIEPNAEAGSGVNSIRLNADTGWVATATRVIPKKSRVLISARFKGSVAATGGGRFKAYYRHTFTPTSTNPDCVNQFYNNRDLNNTLSAGLPAFTILYSSDFNLTTGWSSLPAFTGSGTFMPAPPAAPGPGEWSTDFKIQAENNTPGTTMWVDNFIGVAI
jgi:hypothetical protein